MFSGPHLIIKEVGILSGPGGKIRRRVPLRWLKWVELVRKGLQGEETFELSFELGE